MADVKVIMPSIIASATGGEREVRVSAYNLGEVVKELIKKYGEDFRDRILDEEGKPRRLLNFFINGKNARFLKEFETPLKDGDEIFILPTVSGG
ncbi:MAG: MoaD family protein [Nitrososphaerales archaeon]